MVKKRRGISKIPKELLSKKILSLLLDDISLFGSIPFYIFITLVAYLMNDIVLFSRLIFCFVISFVVVIVIKKVHYKDRPQKEEFTIFMERMVASSFPSTHSLTVTLITILVCVSYPFLSVISLFSVLSLLIYIQRYVTKKHFFVDILGGVLIGVIEAIFVIRIL